MFELDIVDKINRIESQLFESGQFKKSLDASQVAYLYTLLEELSQELKDEYAYKERIKRERAI